MDSAYVQSFLDHPRRSTIVWAITIVFGLMFVIPAWDHYSIAKSESIKSKTRYRELAYSIANIELMRSKMAEHSEVSVVQDAMIDAEAAQHLRETVTQLAQRSNCRIRRLTMTDPYVRPWRQGDDPFDIDALNEGEETDFMLETRTLTLSVDGTLAQLTKLTVSLGRLDRFAVPSNLTLQREGIDGHLTLDVEISLFNLAETFD